MKIDKQNAPYILTKPIHATQKIMREESDGIVFSLDVTWNYELEREILGFGESIHVLSPRRLRNKIAGRIRRMHEQYQKSLETAE